MTLFDRAKNGYLPQLAVEFFVVFSRFEYAMKTSGTYARPKNGGVEADWDRLSDDLGISFFDEVKWHEVANLLIEQPPKKQILDSCGSLGWRDLDGVSDTKDLFKAIRRVRNNLFHGGKNFPENDGSSAYIDDRDRNEILLSESLAVLALVLKKKSEINCLF